MPRRECLRLTNKALTWNVIAEKKIKIKTRLAKGIERQTTTHLTSTIKSY